MILLNNIAKEKVKDILNSFKSDSTGKLESRAIRAEERDDSHIYYFHDLYKVWTPEVLFARKYYNTLGSSFSKKRSLFDEDGRGSLSRYPRRH